MVGGNDETQMSEVSPAKEKTPTQTHPVEETSSKPPQVEEAKFPVEETKEEMIDT